MDALIELILELFFEIFLGLFSELFDKVVYKVSANRRAVRILKIVVSILFLSVAVVLLVIAAIKNSGGILGASIIFILCMVLINLFKFMNNNMFKKRWLNIVFIVISDIVHYSYYIALFVLADTLGESSKGWIYSIAVICILITFLIDLYRISKSYNKKTQNENTVDNPYEVKEEEDKNRYIFVRGKEHKKRICIKYALLTWILSFLIFGTIFGVLACMGVDVSDGSRKESLITILILFSIFFVSVGAIVPLSFIMPIFNESEIVEAKDNKIIFQKFRGAFMVYNYEVRINDILVNTSNGIYGMVGLNRIKVKLINPQTGSKVYKSKCLSICHGATRQEKDNILKALKVYDKE